MFKKIGLIIMVLCCLFVVSTTYVISGIVDVTDNSYTEEPKDEPGTEEPGTETPGDEPGTNDPNGEQPGGNEEIQPVVKENPTIYLAGDSTVKTYNATQYIAGWGQYLDLFLPDNINVINCAQGGRSSRSFINEGRLFNIDDSKFKYTFSENGGKSIEDVIEAGDYLFIQFGHNDDDTKKSSSYTTIYDRMAPLGTPTNGVYPTTVGDKVSTSILPTAYTNLATASEETSALTTIAKYGSEYYSYDSGTYKGYLKMYIDFAREVGATPVLVTPVARVKFSGNSIIGGAGLHGDNFAYVQAVRQLAQEEECLLIDLFADSKEMLETASSTYANYLMALKPNDLTGTWPSGYDGAYGNSEAGYTGIEATHYNKYGAYLQAAKVAEHILNSEDVKKNQEQFRFASKVLTTPEEYINPSNLISKSKVALIEGVVKDINITDPNRTYANPNDVIDAINTLSAKTCTNDNYLELQAECEAIRALYATLNVDDRTAVTNMNIVAQYEATIEEFIEANRPKPTKVVVFAANDIPGNNKDELTSNIVSNEFTLVSTSSSVMKIASKSYSFTYNGESYEASKAINLNGKISSTSRYVEFNVEGPCVITVAAQSSSSSADRTLTLNNSSGTSVATFDAPGSATYSTIDVANGGTYRLGSTGSGVYLYYIIIEYFE